MRNTIAQSIRQVRDETKQPSEIYAMVLDVDYLNKSVLVQIGSRATWVKVVSSLELGMRENPIVVPNGQVQLVRWGGDQYVAAAYVAKMYLPMIGVGMRASAPMASLGTPQWLSGYPRVIGATLDGAWTVASGATGYEVWANTTPSANGAWRIPKNNPMTYATTMFSIPYNNGQTSELLSNGGFESGDFSGFTQYNQVNEYWKIISSDKHGGSYSAYINKPATLGYWTTSTLNTIDFSAQAGQTYALTFWHKLVSSGSDFDWGNVACTINYWKYVNGVRTLVSQELQYLVTPRGSWTLYDFGVITTPATTEYINVTFAATGSQHNTDFTFSLDDISFVGMSNVALPDNFYAVRAVDGAGNTSAFSSWLQPVLQSATLGAPDMPHVYSDYNGAQIGSSLADEIPEAGWQGTTENISAGYMRAGRIVGWGPFAPGDDDAIARGLARNESDSIGFALGNYAGGEYMYYTAARGLVIASASLTNSKIKYTAEGGLAIKLTNRTGAASVKGYLVRPSDAYDNAFRICAIDVPDIIGAVYESGIADGAECWVVVSGIAQVYFAASVTRGQFARLSRGDDATYGNGMAVGEAAPSSPFSTDKHFMEVGHIIESHFGAGLAKIVMHFN